MTGTRDEDTRADARGAALPARTAILGACALGAVGIAVSDAGAGEEALEAPPPPALAAAAAPCADHEAPSARASALEHVASAKAARYAFVPAEGIAALDLLAEARQCREEAGDASDAARAAARLGAWTARLERDYRGHRLRLARAREQGRAADALVEVRALVALLGARGGPYVVWLRSLALDLADEARKEAEP